MLLDPSSVLIIGEGPTATLCSHALVNQGQGRFRLAGVVPAGDLLSYLGLSRTPAGAAVSTRGHAVPHRMVVALDDRRGQLPLPELVSLRFQGVKIQDAASFLEDMSRKIPVRSVRPGDLLFSSGFHFSRWLFWSKSIVEWLMSSVLLLFVLPIIALAALAILVETGRPVFFLQTRIGLRGRQFKVIKLRTMYQDAERAGPRFATTNDARITPLGRRLRLTRIDELPQLFNVLKGDMALIGPRPERPEFVESFNELIPYFNYRHSVRPGITGWAQVRFGYTDDADGSLEKLSYDLFYIKHLSLMLDVKVLLLTIKTVLCGEGR